MALGPELVGREFQATEPYDVSRAAIAQFAAALGQSYGPADLDAPPTFPIVVAFAAMQRLLRDPSVGIELRHVVHADQRFEVTRPVRPGDLLVARLTLTSYRQAAGADLLGTSSVIATTRGDHVCTSYASLMHIGPAGESGEAGS